MIISIVSGKGGVGKTTAAANLGIALQQLGKKVCVVDANITTSNLGLHLGLVHYPVTLHEVLKNKFPIIDSLYIHESGLRILPGSLSLEISKNMRTDNIQHNLGILDKKFDYVIIDAAPGIEKEAITAIEVADEILIVTNPELPAITDAIKIIELAKRNKKTVKGIVLNKIFGKDFEPLSEEIESVTNVPVIGEIPFDMRVVESVAEKMPVVISSPNSSAAKAFFRLAERIALKERKMPLNIFGWFRNVLQHFSRKKIQDEFRSEEKYNNEKELHEDFESELRKQILQKLKERGNENKFKP